MPSSWTASTSPSTSSRHSENTLSISAVLALSASNLARSLILPDHHLHEAGVVGAAAEQGDDVAAVVELDVGPVFSNSWYHHASCSGRSLFAAAAAADSKRADHEEPAVVGDAFRACRGTPFAPGRTFVSHSSPTALELGFVGHLARDHLDEHDRLLLGSGRSAWIVHLPSRHGARRDTSAPQCWPWLCARRLPDSPFADDAALAAALRNGDEAAFGWLVDRYDGSLRRLARTYVSTAAVADEVVQETWLAVVKGIDGFEGRSSVSTWMYRILANIARTRGVREQRTHPVLVGGGCARRGRRRPPSTPTGSSAVAAGPGVDRTTDPLGRGSPRSVTPLTRPWRSCGRRSSALPPAQREVITLRDVEGWTSEEVCNALDLTETNQRVLLHRARSKVRRALEEHVEEGVLSRDLPPPPT